MNKSVLLLIITLGMVFNLSAEKVSIQGKRFTMTELLLEAANQVNKEVRLDFKDPAPVKNYYDCEIEFDSVVTAVKGYFLDKFNIELESVHQNGVLLLKPKFEDIKYQAPVKNIAPEKKTSEKDKKSKSKWKGLFGNWFSKKGKTKEVVEEDSESTSIKRMVYPDDEVVSDLEDSIEKPDYDQTWTIPSKIKVEVLPTKRSMPQYLGQESVDESGLIKLKPMSSQKTDQQIKKTKTSIKKVEKPVIKKQVLMELDDIFIESETPVKEVPIKVKEVKVEKAEELHEIDSQDEDTSVKKEAKGEVELEKISSGNVKTPKTDSNNKPEIQTKEKSKSPPKKVQKKDVIEVKEETIVKESKVTKKPIEVKKKPITEDLPKVEAGVNKSVNVDINEEENKTDIEKPIDEALDFPDL